MTPERFWIAMALFHVTAIALSGRMAASWRDATLCRLPPGAWLMTLARNLARFTVGICGFALAAAVIANLADLPGLRLGSIAGRLMSQGLFGEAPVLAAGLAFWHGKAHRPVRAASLAAVALGLFAVYVDAYHVEPHLLRVRWHVVDRGGGASEVRTIRILHITDIQTPRVGAHEERALRAGLEYRPDLIVLTGDYVQDEMGHPTEERAKHDLLALMGRVHFEAPLGVFATEGDAGLPCRNVFAGTSVRCLVDESALVALPGGDTIVLTGLSGRHGRVRDTAWLAALMAKGPSGRHRVFIAHAPDFVDALPEPVDLVLAGHTHGGQVVIPFFGPPRTASRLPRLYAGGLHDFQGTPLHVSRGVGMERGFAPPVRFLCPPEICLVDLRLRVGDAGSAVGSDAAAPLGVSSAGEHPVQSQEQDGAENRRDPACGVVGPPERSADERPDERARYPQKRCDDETARVPPRHQQLRDHANHEPEDDLPNDVHISSPEPPKAATDPSHPG
jgi:uncharacterized protein